MKDQSIWDFKVVKDKDRSFQTVDTYHDKAEEVYNFDSNVPNHKRVKIGDIVIVRSKEIILGISRIEDINYAKGKKNIKYCPVKDCRSYDIEARKTKRPMYRCSNKHEFDIPDIKTIDITKISARYPKNYISLESKNYSIDILKRYYPRYNPTNSIQELDNDVLKLFPEVNRSHSNKETKQYSLPADEALTMNENKEEYQNSGQDEREIAFRQIKERRGQQKFRNDLRKRYGDICMVTGCTILDILEAAHINPYRGENDNHVSNGLLLRSDIHTLFDLNLIGIEPGTLIIHVHKRAHSQYKPYHEKTLLGISKSKKPSDDALGIRWIQFNQLL